MSVFFPTMNMNCRAQAGVGSLIVFMALVLAAAVGAGVLIQTSGKLQRQASDTGEHAMKEVSTKMDVQSVVGYSSTNKIDKLILTVSAGAGGVDIKLEDVVLSYQSKDIYITGIKFNATAKDNNSAADFYTVAVKGDGGDILEQGEIMQLHFWIEDAGGQKQLDTNAEFTLTVTPKTGTLTRARARTPAMLLYNYTALI